MEVALAVVVVGVGIMAVFSLIATGLDSSRKAIDETQASIFAENVFNGLRAAALEQAEKGANGGGSYWADFWNGTVPITVAADSTWTTPPTISWTAAGSVPTPSAPVIFKNKSENGANLNNIVNNSLRYWLGVDVSHVNDSVSPKVTATLYVWPGAYGDSATAKDPAKAQVFYTEFNNPGDI